MIPPEPLHDKQQQFHNALIKERNDLTRAFATHVLTALVDKELITDSIKEQILSQEHTGFSVWAGETIAPDQSHHRQFLARYLERAPLSLQKLATTDSGIEYHSDDGQCLWKGDPLDFLARLTPHIPNRFEATTRYFQRLCRSYQGCVQEP